MIYDKVKKKHSIFSKFLFSYVIILLIPFTSSLITYFRVKGIVESEINRANNSILKQIKNTLDGKIVEFQGISFQTAGNSRVVTSSKDDADSIPADGFNDYQIQLELNRYVTSNNYINKIFIYYNKSQTILSNDTKLTAQEFYDTFYKTDYIKYNEWKDIIGRKDNKNVSAIYTKEGEKTIVLMQSMPIDNRENHLAKIVIVFDSVKLQTFMENSEWLKDGAALVFNKSGELLISSNSEFNSIDISKYDNKDSFFYDKINGEKCVMRIYKSSDTSCSYVSIIPYSVFWEKVYNFRNINIVSIVLSMIFGGVTAFYLTKRNYNPVKLIINRISEKAKVNYDNKENDELEFIDTVFNMTIEEKELLKERLRSGQDILRENFLYKALHGRIMGTISLENSFNQYNIELLSEYFSVILLSVEGYADYDVNQWIDDEQQELVGFIIRNVLEELVGKKHQGFVVQLDKKTFACIVNLKHMGYVENVQSVVEMCEVAKKFFEDRFKIYCTIAISNINKSGEGIHKAYKEALDAIEYRIVLGKNCIITYEAIQKRISNYNYNTKTELSLMNFIKNSTDDTEIQKIVEEIFLQNRINEEASLEMTKCFIFDISSIMAKIMNEICAPSFIQENSIINKMIASDTLVDFKGELTSAILEVCNYLKSESNQNLLSFEVMKYIDLNFFNSNISVNMLGEKFDISPSYLSKLFREQNKISVLDYLCKVRIKKSKELLKVSEMGISDIAEKVGFLSSSVFIRTFKKYEGITPGAFRDL
jgi:YesN/AraC family two-component response regulator